MAGAKIKVEIIKDFEIFKGGDKIEFSVKTASILVNQEKVAKYIDKPKKAE